MQWHWIALLAAFAGPGAARPDREPFDRHIESLREKAAIPIENERSAQAMRQAVTGLEEVERILDSGLHLLALQRMAPMHIRISAYHYAFRDPELLDIDLEAFQAEWRKSQQAFQAKKAQVERMDLSRVPAVARALGGSSLVRAGPLLKAGRVHAANSSVMAGLYYTGQGLAHLDWAAFCFSLKAGRAHEAPRPAKPLGEVLATLEEEVGEAYSAPGAASEQHSRFIALNAALKAAREALGADLTLAAVHTLLDARLRLEMIRARGREAPSPSRLRARLAPHAKRLSRLKGDHSIAGLFLQMAEDSLAGQAEEPQLQRAAAALEAVLPAYFALIEENP